ncbi:MAG: hypothetical protein ACI8P9_002089 [Parasphingorhabdus sp.]|jgi:hypothetical protein
MPLDDYGIMSNHFQIVLRLIPTDSQLWPNTEICERCLRLFVSSIVIVRFWTDVEQSEDGLVYECLGSFRISINILRSLSDLNRGFVP